MRPACLRRWRARRRSRRKFRCHAGDSAVVTGPTCHNGTVRPEVQVDGLAARSTAPAATGGTSGVLAAIAPVIPSLRAGMRRWPVVGNKMSARYTAVGALAGLADPWTDLESREACCHTIVVQSGRLQRVAIPWGCIDTAVGSAGLELKRMRTPTVGSQCLCLPGRTEHGVLNADRNPLLCERLRGPQMSCHYVSPCFSKPTLCMLNSPS